MGHVAFNKNKFTLEYIPHRLAALELCVTACDAVLCRGPRSDPFELKLGLITLEGSKFDPVVGMMLDSGLMAIRSILNFLGIKLDNGQLINQSYALTIERYNLPLVPLQTALSVLSPDIDENTLSEIWVEALTTASKATAHFTESGGAILVNRLAYAAYATSLALRKHFFQATNTLEPTCLIPEFCIPDYSPNPNVNSRSQHIQ